MKKLLLFCALFLIACFVRAEVENGKNYRIVLASTYSQKNSFSLFPEDAKIESNGKVNLVLWTETNVAAQRWKAELDGDLVNFRNDYAKTCVGLSNINQIQSNLDIVMRTKTEAKNGGSWRLEPVEGKDDTYIIYNGKNKSLCLAAVNAAKDGVQTKLLIASNVPDERKEWRIVEDEVTPLTFTEKVRDDALNNYLKAFYHESGNYHVLDNGGWWGDAECFEAILDAFETTGNITIAKIFDELYQNFIQRNNGTWFASGKGYNEYNDDIAWMVLACVRGYKYFGDIKYLNTAKSNFDGMYRRGLQKFGTLIWKMSQENKISTNSCINCPAAIAAMYLGDLTGDASYYDKAISLYAGQRKLLFEPNTGKVYDSGAWTEDGNRPNEGLNTWSSTYNQGTMLGAAIMLYLHTGDEMYKKDAEMIHKYTVNANNGICNTYGVIKTCQTADGDLTGFKGIYMRYARRYAEDLNHPEVLDWLALNGWHAHQNRNTEGVIWSAWLSKTSENRQRVEGNNTVTAKSFSCSTALSAIFNAHINAKRNKSAYETLGVESFDEIQFLTLARTSSGPNPETADSKRDGAFVAFKNVNFDSTTDKADKATIRAKGSANAKLRLYIDKITPENLIGESGNLSSNWEYVTVNTKAVTGVHHIYIEISGGTGALTSIRFGEGGTDNAIRSIFSTNSKPLVRGVYDLLGRLVTTDSEAFLANPAKHKGIYIVDGKKVIVK